MRALLSDSLGLTLRGALGHLRFRSVLTGVVTPSAKISVRALLKDLPINLRYLRDNLLPFVFGFLDFFGAPGHFILEQGEFYVFGRGLYLITMKI